MDWRSRETARFASGEYRELPWTGEDWWVSSDAARDLFAHVSVKDLSKVAYTPDERFGREDRQLQTKPGRFLNKYFGDVLTPNEITHWAGIFAGENEESTVRFARTPDEIEMLYTFSGGDSGVSACMSRAAEHYSGPCHPTRIYGADELAIAYLGTVEHCTARVLTRNEPKIYGRAYGDTARLTAGLRRLGYSPDSGGDFDGAKLLRIEYGGGFVGPYLDNCYGVEDHGDYLTMAHHGGYSAQNTDGTIAAGPVCDRCGDRADEDYSTTVGDAVWCEDCFSNHGFFCANCHDVGDCEDSITVGDEQYCEYCADQISFVCDECGERTEKENGHDVDGDDWCEACWEEKARYCEHCEKYYDVHCTNFETVDGDDWCEYCVDSDAVQCSGCEEYYVWDTVEDGTCEDCARAAKQAEKDEDQLPLFPDTALVVPGPGTVWVPTGSSARLWYETVLCSTPPPYGGRGCRSGAVELWNWCRNYENPTIELIMPAHCRTGACEEHTRVLG